MSMLLDSILKDDETEANAEQKEIELHLIDLDPENPRKTFIEAKEKRRGFGRMLLEGMTRCIKPYHSVFVYRLASNEVAGEFYRSFGFKETKINGLYGGDDAIINVISYEELCQNLLIK